MHMMSETPVKPVTPRPGILYKIKHPLTVTPLFLLPANKTFRAFTLDIQRTPAFQQE
jgi:hypothetical protein